MAELSPRNCAGWLHTCFSLDKVARTTPFRLMPSLNSLQGLVGLFNDGCVERGLFLGQRAKDLHFQLVRQVGDDGLVGLEAAEQEWARQALQTLGRLGIVVGLDRDEEAAFELRLRSQEAGVEELHDRPQVADVVFDRRAGEGDAIVGRQRTGSVGLFGFRVFDVLGFVQHDPRPRHIFEQVKISVQQGVAGENEGLFPRLPSRTRSLFAAAHRGEPRQAVPA